MLTVSEALAAVLNEVRPFAPSKVPLDAALGLVLADKVVSDVDLPPFDKALMDGFAVRAADVTAGLVELEIIEEVMAGQLPVKLVGAGQATRIMTGAPLPEGADAVVRIEETRFDAQGRTVHITTTDIQPEANLMRAGTNLKRGAPVSLPGRVLRPQELGALAELGIYEVSVRHRPRVAVLATGDELVPIDQTPQAGQIRNSNETMLLAQLRRAGAEPVPLGIARDEPEHLGTRIQLGLECDMLLLSGGVSAGKLDLVPSQLEAAGVRKVFHKVHVKPGKPLWFGVYDGEPVGASMPGEGRCYVFGLPGNPVSSMVCFELFARTVVRRLMGIENASPQTIHVPLAEQHTSRGDRPTYYPAELTWSESGPSVRPLVWQGSSDLQATMSANAMIVFPKGECVFEAGERVDVIEWG